MSGFKAPPNPSHLDSRDSNDPLNVITVCVSELNAIISQTRLLFCRQCVSPTLIQAQVQFQILMLLIK